jgi:hypothetical protein
MSQATFNANYTANDAAYRNVTNTSYYLVSNPYGYYNSTTLSSAETDPKWTANYSAATLTLPNNLAVTKNFSVDSNVLFVDSSTNNVGVGTTAPQQKLHVNGTILANGTISSVTDVCIQSGKCLSQALISYTESDPKWTANYSDYLTTKDYALNETKWGANYSTFLTHITWANAVNGTLMSQATFNANYTANDAAYRNVTNTSYYLVSNPYGYYNSTTLSSAESDPKWTANYSDYLNTKSYALNDPKWTANYSAATLTLPNSLAVTKNLSVDSNVLFVDSSTNRVGIGTTSPQSTLHLGSSSGGANIITLGAPSGSAGPHGFDFKDDTGDVGASIYYRTTPRAIKFETKDSGEVMHIGNDGKIGLGTDAPSQKLHIQGNTNVTGNLTVGGATVFMSGGNMILRV